MPVGPQRRGRLLRLIYASGAVEAARERLALLRRDAVAALRDSRLKPEQRASYLDLIALFRASSSTLDAGARG